MTVEKKRPYKENLISNGWNCEVVFQQVIANFVVKPDSLGQVFDEYVFSQIGSHAMSQIERGIDERSLTYRLPVNENGDLIEVAVRTVNEK